MTWTFYISCVGIWVYKLVLEFMYSRRYGYVYTEWSSSMAPSILDKMRVCAFVLILEQKKLISEASIMLSFRPLILLLFFFFFHIRALPKHIFLAPSLVGPMKGIDCCKAYLFKSIFCHENFLCSKFLTLC